MSSLPANKAITVRSEQRAYDGKQGFYEHQSEACAGPMRFGIYLPPAALQGGRVPALYFLAGLTCNEETFAIKAGAQRRASALGLALVTCDTSPRATRFDGDDTDWDFGRGAGFYLDALESPWSSAYRMHTYVTRELRELVEASFPIRNDARGIFGHSMGGHGALTIALREPTLYQSVSAFAPIVAPSQVPWGTKAFARYLGPDRARWAEHDTVELLKAGRTHPGTLLIDQGSSDKFLEGQLRPELLHAACEASGQSLQLRMRDGYDHSYYFVATYIDDHLVHHARALSHG
ncbi:MAG: S-formylglutathione hydrolase [Myxococcaceae bacterium]|nr:S-formylglutathione hydrolase [Myxococcaceae bacterium]